MPAFALIAGIAVDYNTAFDVQTFTIFSEYCHHGCNLTYSLNNRFGVIPLNYLQVATSLDAPTASRAGQTLQWNSAFNTEHAPCAQGVLLGVSAVSVSGSSPSASDISFCTTSWNFRSTSFGSLSGVALDTPSEKLDGRLQHVEAIVQVPPFISKHSNKQLTVQFVMVSPLYVGIRMILQTAFLALSIVAYIAFCRAVAVSRQSDPIGAVPEQVFFSFVYFVLLCLTIAAFVAELLQSSSYFFDPMAESHLNTTLYIGPRNSVSLR